MFYKSMIVFTYVTKEICTEKQEIMGKENGNLWLDYLKDD